MSENLANANLPPTFLTLPHISFIMHKILITIIASILLVGCGTTSNFSASSKGDIDELHASCVGPLGVFYINFKGDPILQVSSHRRNGFTEVYFSKHSNIESKKVIWPSEVIFSIEEVKTNIAESGEIGVNVLQEGMAYFKFPGEPGVFDIDIGHIYVDEERIVIHPIQFTYETRKFLMCVQ